MKAKRMAGTALTDLGAITLTSTAKAAASAKGVNIVDLMALVKSHATEMTLLLKQIVAVHPSTGADATNYASLNTIIAELA
jgi:hypothetical protein